VHFTSKDKIFANFSFLGVGKLILAGLSYRRCQRHDKKFIGGVGDTGNSFSAVSLTMVINFRLFGYF
jgi:hypothetical protein